MERNDEDYTYLEWLVAMRYSIDMIIDREVLKLAHDEENASPHETITLIKNIVNRHNSQIPDDIE